jgi:hypothetical protein
LACAAQATRKNTRRCPAAHLDQKLLRVDATVQKFGTGTAMASPTFFFSSESRQNFECIHKTFNLPATRGAGGGWRSAGWSCGRPSTRRPWPPPSRRRRQSPGAPGRPCTPGATWSCPPAAASSSDPCRRRPPASAHEIVNTSDRSVLEGNPYTRHVRRARYSLLNVRTFNERAT